ncbi:hypothetical protein FRC10_006154 [Ceratobasidium sp. 414]|nr:hypothetical protein FRC10_006154 [Ceratobasidium sp. 414]
MRDFPQWMIALLLTLQWVALVWANPAPVAVPAKDEVVCRPFGMCEPCPAEALSQPFCQPYGNRRLIHCIRKSDIPKDTQGGHLPDTAFPGETPAWEACGRVVLQERADFNEFVVRVQPSPSVVVTGNTLRQGQKVNYDAVQAIGSKDWVDSHHNPIMAEDTLSLVFVHGFRGDHTSFQSFPTDLHLHLLEKVPKLQTYVYPTYKTTRSLELARDHFLDCLANNGGRPATSLNPTYQVWFDSQDEDLASWRRNSMRTFDGWAAHGRSCVRRTSQSVHPHVILSGIASLFKSKEGKSETEMNDPQHVEIVSKRDGRPYLQGTDSSLSTLGLNPTASSSSVYLTPPNGDRPQTPDPTSLAPASNPAAPPLPPRTNTTSSTTPTFLPPSLHLSSPRPPVRVMAPKLEQAFETFGLGPVPQPVHDALHFFDKHHGISGVKDWVVQVFEFGGTLLDPQGLIARYKKMQEWGSDESVGPYGRGWVNLWTVTVPKRKGGAIETTDRETDMADAMDLSKMMAEGGSRTPEHTPSSVPSTVSTDASSIQPSLSQTMSSSLSPSTTLFSTGSASSRAEDDSRFKAALEELQQQISAEGISKEDKAVLKENEKQLKVEQKAREKEKKAARKEEEQLAKEAAKQAKKEAKERQKLLDAAAKRARDADKVGSPHHFIILPRKGTDQQWICVPVAGADSEVTAHCGLFFREENFEYDRLVSDVGDVVRGFWDGSGGTRHTRRSA